MMNRIVYYLSSLPTMLFGIQNWWMLPTLFFRNEATIFLRNGPKFNVRSLMDVWIIKETCLDRDYEVHGIPIQNGWTVVDIGAGLGDFTVSVAKAHPNNKIIGLEPFPESFALLNQNLALNNVSNVTAVPIAVGKENGRIQLATSGAAVQHTTSLNNQSTLNGSELIEVETITLETLFNQYNIHQCHFLKLDCEGAEFDILFNASDDALNKISYICMEYHNNATPYTHQDLAKFLQQKGFIVQITVNPVHDYLGFLFAIRK